MGKHLIYGLVDPFTDELRYIGRSSSGLLRPRQHSFPYSFKRTKTHSANWIKSLGGTKPKIIIIEECLSSELNESEIFWISYFKGLGCRLTNISLGGGGVSWGTTEYRDKMLEMHKTRCAAPEVREKLDAARKISISINSKPVTELNSGKSFSSASEAARFFKIDPREVSRAALGLVKVTKGLRFRYV